MSNTVIRHDDGPLLVELVQTDTWWEVTATDGHEDILEPFVLPRSLSATAAFSIAMHRYERALLAQRLGVDEQLLVGGR